MSKNPFWDNRIQEGLWKRSNKEIVRLFEMDTNEILSEIKKLDYKICVIKDMKKVRDESLNLLKIGLSLKSVSQKLLDELNDIQIEEGENRILLQISEFKRELDSRENH